MPSFDEVVAQLREQEQQKAEEEAVLALFREGKPADADSIAAYIGEREINEYALRQRAAQKLVSAVANTKRWVDDAEVLMNGAKTKVADKKAQVEDAKSAVKDAEQKLAAAKKDHDSSRTDLETVPEDLRAVPLLGGGTVVNAQSAEGYGQAGGN